jgi:DNA-binding GntR family transcriptional regulator
MPRLAAPVDAGVMDQSQLRHESLATKVFEIVRNAIVLGEFAPGSLHSVQEIAEKLNISRTPVREALLKLEEQGMVSFERNRGARILETTVHDLEEIFSLRVLLEVPSTYRAAKWATPADIKKLRQTLDEVEAAYRTTSTNARAHLEPDARFHRCIALISGSRRLAGILDNLFDQQMIANGTSGGFTRGMAEISEDHKRIFDGIAARDPPAAAAAMRDHLIVSSRALVAKETGDAGASSGFELLYADILAMNRE